MPGLAREDSQFTRGETARREVEGGFQRSLSYGSNDLRFGAANDLGQGDAWARVGKQNAALANPSGSDNFQANQSTPVFRKVMAERESVGKALEVGERVTGIVVLVNGRVLSCEIFASPEYFRKLWPQIFAGAVVDAAAAEKKQPIAAAAAGEKAQAYLRTLSGADTSLVQENGVAKITVDCSDTVGAATIAPGHKRLIYFRLFPKAKSAELDKKRGN